MKVAAWVLVAITTALTAYAMYLGVDVISVMVGVLTLIWPASLAFLGYAYRVTLIGAASSITKAMGGSK